MLYSKMMNKFYVKVLRLRYALLLSLFAIFGMVFTDVVLAADELLGVIDPVKTNFGTGSTFVKLLYVAEIIAGGYAWHKTKSPAAIIGIVVLAIFMTYALGHWLG